MQLRTAALAIASTIAFGPFALSGIPAANAHGAAPAPCATQQAHVDRATAKLASLTATFAAHPNAHNLKAKKAQVKRVAHATSRLDTCLTAPSS